VKKILLGILLAMIVFVAGCSDRFFQCTTCGSSYKSPAMSPGLPGQFDFSTCRGCGGHLVERDEDQSGWNEEQYQERGNEIDY